MGISFGSIAFARTLRDRETWKIFHNNGVRNNSSYFENSVVRLSHVSFVRQECEMHLHTITPLRYWIEFANMRLRLPN